MNDHMLGALLTITHYNKGTGEGENPFSLSIPFIFNVVFGLP